MGIGAGLGLVTAFLLGLKGVLPLVQELLHEAGRTADAVHAMRSAWRGSSRVGAGDPPESLEASEFTVPDSAGEPGSAGCGRRTPGRRAPGARGGSGRVT